MIADEIARCTKFQVVCPACGRTGPASWTRTENRVKCRGCGEKFDFRDHTYRPVTGGMTEDERRERARAYARAYRAAHRAECAAACKAWRESHRAEVKAYERAYRAAHRAEHAAACKAWRAKHRKENR